MANYSWHPFSELSGAQLYAVLKLRAEVFVVEQEGAYLDPDGKDNFALHLLGIEHGSLVAYLRLFLPEEGQDYLVFGRVATPKSARNKGYGKKLIKELVTYCDTHFPGVKIKCSARDYLKNFYEAFGFKMQGEVYEEDGFLHIAMQRVPKSSLQI